VARFARHRAACAALLLGCCSRFGFEPVGGDARPDDLTVASDAPVADRDGPAGTGDGPADSTDVQAAGPVDRRGLVLLYHFDEGSWSGVAGEVIDSSGRGHHGVAANGATTVAGLLDRAGDFQRAEAQSIDLGDVAALELDPPFSMLFWLKLRTLPSVAGGSYRLFSKSNATGDQREWTVSVSRTGDMLELATDTDGTGLSSRALVPLTPGDVGQWVHVALVVDSAGGVRGYRNGIEVGTATIDPVIYHGTAPVRIGRRTPNGRNSDATLDELAVFTRELAPAEVQAVVQAQAGGDPSGEI
jgi:MSHA biogenesis protein MshQ